MRNNGEMKKVLICNSNMFVPYVLSEVLENDDKEYIILTDTANIIKFYAEVNLPNVVLFSYSSCSISNFISERKKLRLFINKYEVSCVKFYHAEFGNLANWLLIYLSNKGVEINYCKIYDSIPMPRIGWLDYNAMKIRVRERLFYGYIADIKDNGRHYYPSIPDSFFRKIDAKFVKYTPDKRYISQFTQGYVNSLGFAGNMMLLSGSVVQNNLVAQDHYTMCINDIITRIGTKRLCVKLHPRFDDLYGREHELMEIPSYFPGNVIIDPFDIFIGHSSTLLVEAAQQGKLVISYLFLMECLNNDIQTNLYNFLENRLAGKGKIHYPRTVEELINLVSSHS